MMLLSIVIPTYNSSKFIDQTILAIDKFALDFEHKIEIVLVDDGSRDQTFIRSCEIANQCKINISIIQLFRNRGQFHALMAGLRHAKGDFIVTLDDDLEYLPSQIPTLLKCYEESESQVDVVIGVTNKRRRNPIRKFGTWLTNWMNSIMFGKPRNLQSGSFRLMTKDFNNRLIEHQTSNPIAGPLIYKTTQRIKNTIIVPNKGLRSSNYSFFKLISTFIRNIQNFSDFPLRYITVFGLVTATLAFASALFIVFQYFTGIPYPIRAAGWASTMVSIFFFSGAMMASIGLLGQYIFRIIEEVSQSPNYQIREVYVHKKEKS
ncbi:glycosyltransferase [bacterium]|nr:glycosyltransferase [bacterium]